MKLIAGFDEIEAVLKQKAAQTIHFQKVRGGNALNVIYKMQVEVPLIGSVSKDVEVNITFNSIKGTDLDFSYSLPTGLGLVAKGGKAFFGKQIEKTQLLKWGEGENQVILFIDKLLEKLQVEGVDEITKVIQVSDIQVLDEGLQITASLVYENL